MLLKTWCHIQQLIAAVSGILFLMQLHRQETMHCNFISTASPVFQIICSAFCEGQMQVSMLLIGQFLPEVCWNQRMVQEERSVMVLQDDSIFPVSANGELV